MKVTDSYLKERILEHHRLKVGDFYFFEHFVLVEYAEDALVSIEYLTEIITRAKRFYGEDEKFGLIVNKINNYATVPSDAMKLEKIMGNLIYTAVVNYNLSSSVNFELENYFFKSINRKRFDSLKNAEEWIFKMLEAES